MKHKALVIVLFNLLYIIFNQECMDSTYEKRIVKLQFIKEEIEIRIESIRNELDCLAESLMSQLNKELDQYW